MTARRKLLRRITLILGAVGIALFLAALAARQWIIPAYIRGQLTEAVAEAWDGAITVRRVRFRYFGPTELTALRLEDPQGRQWMEAGRLRVRLGRWDGLTPTIADIEVDRLGVHVRESPPVRPLPDVEPDIVFDVLDALGVRRIRVHSLVVGVSHGPDSLNLEPMRLAIDRRGGGYALLAEALPPHQRGFVLQGRLESEQGRFSAELELDREIAPEHYRLARRIAGGDWPVDDVQGRFAGKLELAGSLGQPRAWRVALQGRVEDCSVELPGGVPVERLTARILLRDEQLNVDDISCTLAGGRIRARGRIDWRDADAVYEADATFEDVDPASPAAAMGVEGLRDAALSGDFSFSGSGRRARLRGRGDLRAGLRAGPVRAVGGPFDLDIEWIPDEEGAADPVGRVALRGWDVLADRPLAANLSAEMGVRGRTITLDAASVETMGGNLTCHGEIELPERWPDGLAGIDLGVTLSGVRTDDIAEVLNQGVTVPAGKVDMRADITGFVGADTRLKTTGVTSLEIDPARRIVGDHELEFSLTEDDKKPRLAGRLSDWTWTEEGREIAKLHRAELETRDGELVVGDAIIETEGGMVNVLGRVGADPRGVPVHRWRVSFRGFDPAALLPGDEALPIVRVSMEGDVAGRGAEFLTVALVGTADARWQDHEIDLSSDLSVQMSLEDLLAADPLDRLMLTIEPVRGVVRTRGEELVTALGGVVRLEGGLAGTANLEGEVAGGRFDSELRLGTPEGGFGYDGDVAIHDVDLSRLPDWLARRIDSPETSVSGSFRVVGDEFESLTVDGEGESFARIEAEDEWAAAGKYQIEIRLAPLDPDRPYQPLGKARLSEWSVSNSRGVMAENLRCSVHIFRRSLDFGGIRFDVLDGTALGVLRLDFAGDEMMSYRGKLAADGVGLASIAQAAGMDDDEIAGELDLAYAFAGRGLSPENVRGRGSVSVRDSSMVGVPLVEGLLVSIGARPEAAARTDLYLAFDHFGESMTLTGGRFATPMAAVSPMPGGTVNLTTGELDVHVVAALLDDIERLVEVPVLELFVPLTRRLSRLHVTGTWHSRETVIITKQPIRDVGEGTLQFFKGVVETGGDLGAIVTDPLRDMLR